MTQVRARRRWVSACGVSRRRGVSVVAVATASLALAACGSSSGGGGSGGGSAKSHHALAPIIKAELAGQTPAAARAEMHQPIPLTVGQAVPGYPHGVKPASAKMFHFTAAEIAKLKRGHYTAGIAMHLNNAAWPTLQVAALKKTLARFGIKVVAVTSANGVSSTQVQQLGTLVARRPTAIFSIPVNPTSEASAYKAVSRAGIKLVLLDNVPPKLAPGKDYVTVVSADNGGNGRFAAQQLIKDVGCGEMGWIGLDYNFPVVNARDVQAQKVFKSKCPGATIHQQNLSDLVTTKAYSPANATIERYPNLKGYWAAWDSIAQEIVSAERAQGKKIPIATTDVGPTSALEMAQGYIDAIGAQQPYAQGVAEANALAYDLLGKKVPPFIELPTVPVTLEDLIPAYKIVNGSNPPANVISAIKSAVGLS